MKCTDLQKLLMDLRESARASANKHTRKNITSDITKIPADNGELSFHTTWTALESTISGLEGGIDNTDNCYTEDQIKQIINNIEKLTGCCFQTLGFQYITE